MLNCPHHAGMLYFVVGMISLPACTVHVSRGGAPSVYRVMLMAEIICYPTKKRTGGPPKQTTIPIDKAEDPPQILKLHFNTWNKFFNKKTMRFFVQGEPIQIRCKKARKVKTDRFI
jgi:hypothetical protein